MSQKSEEARLVPAGDGGDVGTEGWPGQRVREAGEFGLIARLARQIDSAGLVVGIGDDAAAWHQAEAVVVATTDMLIEGIHFDLALTGWHDLGWKALAVNLSDLAAMGATPRAALVSIGLRGDAPVAGVEALYAGMRELARVSCCAIVGGDTVSVRGEQVINVVALGDVPADEAATLLRRDRGRAGDAIAVTGWLGASSAGLFALQNPTHVGEMDVAALREAHLRPQPRIEAGRLLRRAGVACAMDVSDGLLADLEKLCQASDCGAEIVAPLLPLHPQAKTSFPERSLAWAAGGGEDYELLVTAPAAVMARAREALREIDLALTEIGRLTAHRGVVRLLDASGNDVRVAHTGWDHFGVAPGDR